MSRTKFRFFIASKDVLIIILVSFCVFIASSFFELSEKLLIFTRPFEPYQLDELPIALFSLLTGMTWFAWKKTKQTLEQIKLRECAQINLENVLRENKLLAHKYLDIQERERRELARELHDELGQGLNAIKVDAVNIRQETGVKSFIHESAESIIKISSDIYKTVRDLTYRLRPVALDELGLETAIKYLIDSWANRDTGHKWEYYPKGQLEGLSESINITIYRFVQEAITNIVKHADASNVRINIVAIAESQNKNLVKFEVIDDGVGMNVGQGSSGIGLIGLRERIQAQGGVFEIISNRSEGGTVLRGSIPLLDKKGLN